MFLYNIPIGIILFILAFFFIDINDKQEGLFKKIDYQGIIYLAVGLISLLLFKVAVILSSSGKESESMMRLWYLTTS